MRILSSAALLLILLLCTLPGTQAAAPPPAPPQASAPLVDTLAYQTPAAVQTAWQPMWGTAPATIREVGGQRMLRFPCNFTGTKIERAAWDHPVQLDLAVCRGVRFDCYCADISPISRFSLYFHSGNGWYAFTFGPSSANGWGAVVLNKSDALLEGTPAGWGTIDAIRISAWRGKDTDTEFYLANLGVVGGDAPVILIRDDTGSKSMPSEAEAIAAANRVIARNLDQLGIASVVMSDLDVTGARLRGKKIVILPYNPGMTDSEANELVNYLGAGGKLLAFYQLPAKLADAVGIGGGAHVKQPYAGYFAGIRAAEGGLPGLPPSVNQASWNIRHTVAIPGRSRVVATWWTDKGEPTGEAAIVASANGVFMTHVLLSDDARNKRFLLVSLLDNLNPGVLEQAAATSLAQIGNIGPYRSLDEVARGIGQQPLAQARALQRAAVTAAGAREYRLAMTRAAEAQAAVLRAYCAAQQPKAGEHRAWWCHSAFGVPGMTWDQAIKNLADNGFTAIMVNMLWGGVAYYHSTVLPVAPEVKEQGDQIIACLAACRKYGVQCHVWKVDWNMSQRTPPEFAQRMQREGRTQMGFDGKAEPLWLCPSNPANQQLEIDAMVEVATRYDVDGIHFDYIRYPDDQHCFCPGCRARFEATIGKAVANWPADVLKDPALRQQWLDFRRANITRVVAAVHDAVKKAKPRVQISAAVFPNWPVDHDQVGQDWKLWCERGYLDFVCPMDYTQSTALLTNMVSQQLTYAGKVPCYPGIGLSTWDSEPDVVKLIEQINAVRQAGAGGFTIFNYGVPEADIAVPLCGAGMTRKN